MHRTIEELAKDIARDAVNEARGDGYHVKRERVLFFISDMGKLESDIAYWIENHMTLERD